MARPELTGYSFLLLL